ncbi:uncharacterized protein LOC115331266 [Ixodes scapularis]|uniref:uncharacterized protein LOC115331266 n=1 Tax=Ixodes scapularis TaxID=6945 RepID=UPI001A9E085C|nr:uncharacterized protein LOC115331266 [Ixodes scapularis]
MKSWTVLSILLVLYGGISCAQAGTSKGKSPTAKFYERMQYIPFIWYQCYRNGSFLETPNTIITSGLWDGTSGNNECAKNTIWEIFNGTARSSTTTTFSTYYDPESEVGYLTINGTLHESFTILQEPYKEMAYFVAYGKLQNILPVVYKIYDRVESCVNADQLLPMVCPDGCGMISTKLNLSP